MDGPHHGVTLQTLVMIYDLSLQQVVSYDRLLADNGTFCEIVDVFASVLCVH